MKKLTSSERQAPTGPLVVGSLLGALAGLASWGFDSEYSYLDHWRMALNASLEFLTFLAIAVVPLAAIPMVLERLRQRKRSASDA